MFDDPEQMEFLKGAVEEARGLAEQKVKEKRKLAAKQGKTAIEEDEPEKVWLWWILIQAASCPGLNSYDFQQRFSCGTVKNEKAWVQDTKLIIAELSLLYMASELSHNNDICACFSNAV